MDVEDYFRHRERDFQHFSAAPDNLRVSVAEDGQSGRLKTNLGLAENAFVAVFERVVVRDGAFEVEKYAYALVIDGATAWAYDKHPGHEPAVHGHIGPDRTRVPAHEVTLAEVLDEAWQELDWRAEQYFGEEAS